MFTINILDTIEKFYVCTYLPIIALEPNSDIIGTYGYNDNFHYLFKRFNVAEKARNLLNDSFNERLDNYWVTIPITSGAFFSGCLIDPKDINSGLYILGPHSCHKNNSMNIPYKPKCLISHLISLLYKLDNECNCKSQKGHGYSFHIKKALDYINSRYYDDISLVDTANYLNINKSYLCSLLKKETGKTFTMTLNEIRIEKSKKLLLESNSSILDIALTVGFNNQNYFNIMFKKITDMTPLQFRNAG